MQPLINRYYDRKLKMALRDPARRSDMNENNIMNQNKLYVMNGIKISILVIHILFLSYYIGQYWLTFSVIANHFKLIPIN